MILNPMICQLIAGITRRSVLELAREWGALGDGTPLEVNERPLAMGEVDEAAEEGRVRSNGHDGAAWDEGGGAGFEQMVA